MIPLGIVDASTGIVGNCIGSGNVPLAKRFFEFSTKVNTMVVALCCLVLATCRTQIASVYTDNREL